MTIDLKLLWLVGSPPYRGSPVSSASIDQVVDSISQGLLEAFHGQTVTVSLSSADHTVRGAQEMLSRIEECHAAVVDITGADPDILYAIGLLAARSVPMVLIGADADSVMGHGRLPLAEARVLQVRDYDAPPVELHREVARVARALVHQPVVTTADLKGVWFGASVGDLHVVAAREDQPTPYTSLTDPNYIYIDNLIDRDTLLGTFGFLSRQYPTRRVVLTAAENNATEPRPYLEGDLVVVGGPGVPKNDIVGNPLCQLMSESAGCEVAYSEDGESVEFRGETFGAEYTERGVLKKDFGYFARFPNPFNPACSVVMVHGLHTLGVLGAFRAFSDHPLAYGNVSRAVLDFGPGGSFEAGFVVDVHDGSVVVPRDVAGDRLAA